MPNLDISPNRFYPSIPGITEDSLTHTNALQQIRESIETHERRNANYLKSFVRFEELVTLGIISEDGEFILDTTISGVEEAPIDGNQYARQDAGWTVVTPGVTDHTNLTSIGTNTHAQIDTHIGDSTIHFTQASLDSVFLRLDTTNDPLTGSLQIDSNLIDLNNSASSGASTIINRNSAGGVTLNVNTTTGNAQIGQTSGAGAAEDVWINFIRNAGVQLRYDNTIKMETTTDGVAVPAGDIFLDNTYAINWENAAAAAVELLDFDAGVAGDPSWSQVQLLADFEGADGATTYTELSDNGLAATFVNQAEIDTADSNFGSSSALFDGTGDQVTFPNDVALEFGSVDWTVEFFFEMDSLLTNPEVKYLAGHHGTAGNQPWAMTLQADGFSTQRGRVFIEGFPEVFTINQTTLAINTWYHVCIERTGSNYYVGINGFREFSNTGVLSGAMETSDVAVMLGDNPNVTHDSELDGHIDDMRITIGSNRYDLANNSTYTVPTSYTVGGGTPETFTVGDPSYPTEIDGSLIGIKKSVGVNWDNEAGDNVELLVFTGNESLVSNNWGDVPSFSTEWSYIGITHDTAALESTGICQNLSFGMDILSVSDDGLNVLVGSNSDDQIMSFVLDTPWDFSNATQTGTTRSLTNPWYRGQWTNSGNGYIIQTADNNLREFTTSSPYTISSGDSNIRTVTNTNLGFPSSGETSYWMSRDGTILIGCGEGTVGGQDVFVVWDLTTPYNISTYVSRHTQVRMDNITNGPTGQFEGQQWTEDGLTVVGIFNRNIYIGTLSVAFDPSTLTFAAGNNRNVQTDAGAGGADANQIIVEPDGNTVWVTSDNATDPKIFEYNKDTPNPALVAEGFFVGDPNYPTNIEGSEVQINGEPHATHTGEVIGGTDLTVQVSSITNRLALPALAETTDEVAIHDQTDGSLRKAAVDSLTDGGFF